MSRTKFIVTVAVTRENELTVWAEDEDEAEEKACERAEAWDGVTAVDVLEIEEA